MTKKAYSFGDNRLKRITRFLYKWLFCAWLHKKNRCSPSNPKSWHCTKCHPCGEEFDLVSGNKRMRWL